MSQRERDIHALCIFTIDLSRIRSFGQGQIVHTTYRAKTHCNRDRFVAIKHGMQTPYANVVSFNHEIVSLQVIQLYRKCMFRRMSNTRKWRINRSDKEEEKEAKTLFNSSSRGCLRYFGYMRLISHLILNLKEKKVLNLKLKITKS